MTRAVPLIVVLLSVLPCWAGHPLVQTLQQQLKIQQRLLDGSLEDLETHQALMQETWERVNRLSDDLTRAELFISIFLLIVDPASRLVRFTNAGHNPALILRKGEKNCSLLDADGLLTGVLPDSDYPVEELSLEPGDLPRQFLVLHYGLSESHESPDHEYAHFYCTCRIQDAGGHYRSVLSECIWACLRVLQS